MSETTAGIDRTVTPYQASEGQGALDGRRPGKREALRSLQGTRSL